MASRAETVTTTTPIGGALNAVARLDFTVNIGPFIFLRVGNTGLNNIDTVTFSLTPAIPAAAVTPVAGNNAPVAWSGGSPIFTPVASGNVLPVEVRSNTGQVSLRATTAAPLTSGSNTIPMSQITVTSSNAALPAPPIPDSGIGTSVNVTGGGTLGGATALNNLVTLRGANWTFAYANTVSPAAGVYSGQIAFTASSP